MTDSKEENDLKDRRIEKIVLTTGYIKLSFRLQKLIFMYSSIQKSSDQFVQNVQKC